MCCFCNIATDKIDRKHLNHWVKSSICAYGKDYLKELAEVLLPGVGTREIRIVMQNHPDDIQSCFTGFFDVWSEREVEPTWQKLIDALKYTNKNNLAIEIENMLILPQPVHQHEQDGSMEGQKKIS